ncbi:MAG: hypothetical protein AAF340_12475 [Pseudomonadota bacterium]
MKPTLFEKQAITALLKSEGNSSIDPNALVVLNRQDNVVGSYTTFASTQFEPTNKSDETIAAYFYNETSDCAIGIMLEMIREHPVELELFSYEGDPLPVSIEGFELVRNET